MRAYIEFARKVFVNNMVYRFDYITGIINTLLQFFIFWCIYKSLYGSASEIDGITFKMVSTNFILALGLSNIFSLDDLFIERKVRDGSIANEFLKPVNFKLRLLSENIGAILFRLIFNFAPAILVASLLVGIEKPDSPSALLLFLISSVFGFLILWQISFIIQMTSFWITNVWSLSTIKDVIINVLSGAFLPLWFMPAAVMNVLRYTPFDTIYFLPVQLYLGNISKYSIPFDFARQAVWIIVLYAIGEYLWRRGQRKLVVQGG